MKESCKSGYRVVFILERLLLLPEGLLILVTLVENWRLRRGQIRPPAEAQQEAKGQPLLRDPYPQRAPSSTHCRPHRLSGVVGPYTPGHGVLPAGGSVVLHQEA